MENPLFNERTLDNLDFFPWVAVRAERPLAAFQMYTNTVDLPWTKGGASERIMVYYTHQVRSATV